MSGANRGSWKPGTSGNPAGRASTTKALIAAGIDPDSLRAEVIQKNVELFRTLDPGDKDEGATWRACNEKCWILVALPAKPAEQADAHGALTPDEYEEELKVIAREQVDKLTPEEKFQWLSSDTAPNDTLQ